MDKNRIVEYLISTFTFKNTDIQKAAINDRLQEFINGVQPPKLHKEFDLILEQSGLKS